MKIISKCEREFVSNIISKRAKRLDGRSLQDARTLEIIFGQEWGCCEVLLGNTCVLCQISAEVTEPKTFAPTEGCMHINLELSMAASDVINSRNSDESVVYQRSLERCIQESKCVDLESLCIVAGSKVWTIRVDIHGLNDDGNLLECASIAAISALAHFKRPDVTVVGTEVTVHSLDDREPVPLNLHHLPIIVNLALYEQGSQILVDPTDIEERIADGCYIMGMNNHEEICFITRRGVLLLSLSIIQKCEDIVARRAQEVIQVIRKAQDDDAYKRATKAPFGFVHMLQTGSILGAKHPIHKFDLDDIRKQQTADLEASDEVTEVAMEDENVSLRTTPVVVSAAKERALRILKESETAVFEGGASKWDIEPDDDDDEEEDSSSEEESVVKTSVADLKQEMEISSEEETGFIESNQVDIKPTSSSRSWYSKNPFS